MNQLALHDTVLKRYRVAAGSARPLGDYHLMHGFSIIHDYHLLHDSAMEIATGIAARPEEFFRYGNRYPSRNTLRRLYIHTVVSDESKAARLSSVDTATRVPHR